MSRYSDGEKRIVFTDTLKRHTDFKIRLEYDNFKQWEFFRAILDGYLEKDSRIISFLYDWRENNKKYSKSKRKKTENLLSKGEDLMSKFGLDSEEIDNIFDILEEEHPDL